MGNQAFKLSVSILEEILTQAAALFPNQSFNMVMKRFDSTKQYDNNGANKLQIAVEPTEWTGEGPKPVRTMDMYFTSSLDDKLVEGPVSFSEDPKTRANQKCKLQCTKATKEVAQTDHNTLQGLSSTTSPSRTIR